MKFKLINESILEAASKIKITGGSCSTKWIYDTMQDSLNIKFGINGHTCDFVFRANHGRYVVDGIDCDAAYINDERVNSITTSGGTARSYAISVPGSVMTSEPKENQKDFGFTGQYYKTTPIVKYIKEKLTDLLNNSIDIFSDRFLDKVGLSSGESEQIKEGQESSNSDNISIREINWLKDNPGSKIKKPHYTVVYNDYIDANTNEPVGGHFTVIENRGKDNTRADSAEELQGYITRRYSKYFEESTKTFVARCIKEDINENEDWSGWLVRPKQEWLNPGEEPHPYVVIEDRGSRILIQLLPQYQPKNTTFPCIESGYKEWYEVIDSHIQDGDSLGESLTEPGYRKGERVELPSGETAIVTKDYQIDDDRVEVEIEGMGTKKFVFPDLLRPIYESKSIKTFGAKAQKLTESDLTNSEEPKFEYMMIEFAETSGAPSDNIIRNAKDEKFYNINKLNKLLIKADKAFRDYWEANGGAGGYDKVYFDLYGTYQGKEVKLHAGRVDLGDGKYGEKEVTFDRAEIEEYFAKEAPLSGKVVSENFITEGRKPRSTQVTDPLTLELLDEIESNPYHSYKFKNFTIHYSLNSGHFPFKPSFYFERKSGYTSLFYSKQSLLDYVNNNNLNNEPITEAHYGGAYDIDDEAYFTKEDLVEFANEVIETIDRQYDLKFDINELELYKGVLYLGLVSENGIEMFHEQRIDMRKIKVPKDLNRYLDEFVTAFKFQIDDNADYLYEGLWDDIKSVGKSIKTAVKDTDTYKKVANSNVVKSAKDQIDQVKKSDTYKSAKKRMSKIGKEVKNQVNGARLDVSLNKLYNLDDSNYEQNLGKAYKLIKNANISSTEQRSQFNKLKKLAAKYRMSIEDVQDAAKQIEESVDSICESLLTEKTKKKPYYWHTKKENPIFGDASKARVSSDISDEIDKEFNSTAKDTDIDTVDSGNGNGHSKNGSKPDYTSSEQKPVNKDSEEDSPKTKNGKKSKKMTTLTDKATAFKDAMYFLNIATTKASAENAIRIANEAMKKRLIHKRSQVEKLKALMDKKAKFYNLKEDFDFDSPDFENDDGEVVAGKTFIAGYEYKWLEKIGATVHLDFDNWAVWSAENLDEEGIIEYFVVDEDTGFIDWGPVDTAEEALEFLQSKVDDYNEDEGSSIEFEESYNSSIREGDKVKVSTPGNDVYDGRIGTVDWIDDVVLVIFDDGKKPRMNNFDKSQVTKIDESLSEDMNSNFSFIEIVDERGKESHERHVFKSVEEMKDYVKQFRLEPSDIDSVIGLNSVEELFE